VVNGPVVIRGLPSLRNNIYCVIGLPPSYGAFHEKVNSVPVARLRLTEGGDGVLGPEGIVTLIEVDAEPFIFCACIVMVYEPAAILMANEPAEREMGVNPPPVEYAYVIGEAPPSSWKVRGIVTLLIPYVGVPKIGAPGTVEGVVGPAEEGVLYPLILCALI
jgi:hypothetical protein